VRVESPRLQPQTRSRQARGHPARRTAGGPPKQVEHGVTRAGGRNALRSGIAARTGLVVPRSSRGRFAGRSQRPTRSAAIAFPASSSLTLRTSLLLVFPSRSPALDRAHERRSASAIMIGTHSAVTTPHPHARRGALQTGPLFVLANGARTRATPLYLARYLDSPLCRPSSYPYHSSSISLFLAPPSRARSVRTILSQRRSARRQVGRQWLLETAAAPPCWMREAPTPRRVSPGGWRPIRRRLCAPCRRPDLRHRHHRCDVHSHTGVCVSSCLECAPTQYLLPLRRYPLHCRCHRPRPAPRARGHALAGPVGWRPISAWTLPSSLRLVSPTYHRYILAQHLLRLELLRQRAVAPVVLAAKPAQPDVSLSGDARDSPVGARRLRPKRSAASDSAARFTMRSSPVPGA